MGSSSLVTSFRPFFGTGHRAQSTEQGAGGMEHGHWAHGARIMGHGANCPLFTSFVPFVPVILSEVEVRPLQPPLVPYHHLFQRHQCQYCLGNRINITESQAQLVVYLFHPAGFVVYPHISVAISPPRVWLGKSEQKHLQLFIIYHLYQIYSCCLLRLP
jgi:hypothetical protein